MSLLQNPNEISEAVLLAGMIYGQPGVGKTSLALSAPNPVMVDSDQGMRRVQKRFQVPSLILGDYKDLKDLVGSDELAPFDTIIIDTVGRLIDRMGDYIAAEDPKSRKRDGSLSLPGFGRLRTEFRWLMRTVKDHRKHLIFVAHDREERDGDARSVRPDLGPGGSGKELINDLDFIGYMEMVGSDRTISFNPCEKFYAKNSFDLPPLIRVPDIANGNDFIRGYLLDKAKEKMAADDAENQRYLKLIADHKAMIGAMTDAKSANEVAKHMREAPVIWDSQRQARHVFGERIKELGLEYDRATQQYVVAGKPASPPSASASNGSTGPTANAETRAATYVEPSPTPSGTGDAVPEVPDDFDDRAAAE